MQCFIYIFLFNCVVELEMGESLCKMDDVEKSMGGGMFKILRFFFVVFVLVVEVDVGFDYVVGDVWREDRVVGVGFGNIGMDFGWVEDEVV